MNKQEFIKEYNSFLKKENLTPNDAWVGAGGTLLLLGLREETQDIDLGVSTALFNKFKKRNLKTYVVNNDTLVIEYNNVIDVHEENGGNLIIIDSVNSWTVQEVLKLKQRLNRPKDQEDIKNILAYIKKHKLSLETHNPEELVTIVNGKKRRTRTEIYALNYEGLILSCCRPGKYPELPGGGVDIGESPIQAAQRECMEESGWLVNNLTQLTIHDNLYIDDDKNDHWFVDCGWLEEIEYAVLAKAIAYQPDYRYTKSEDSLVFSFNSIDRVIADTEEALDKAEMSGLRLWHATFRLQALQVIKATIFPITHTRVLERPIVFNW